MCPVAQLLGTPPKASVGQEGHGNYLSYINQPERAKRCLFAQPATLCFLFLILYQENGNSELLL